MPTPVSASPIVCYIQRAVAAREARTNGETPCSAVDTAPQESQQIDETPTPVAAPVPSSLAVPATPDASYAADAPGGLVRPAAPYPSTGRHVQNVLNKAQRYKIATWMMKQDENGVKKVPSKAVVEFPQFFRSKQNADIARAMRYWRERNTLVQNYKANGKRKNDIYMYLPGPKGLKLRISKTASGRGRKRSPWVMALHKHLCTEFERYRRCRVKFNTSMLLLLARRLISKSDGVDYGPTRMDPKSGELIETHVDKKWVERFVHAHGIVSRVQTGKRLPSAEKQELIQREVAYHLGGLKRDFEAEIIEEDCVFNADETHFVIDLNDGHTLAMKGDTEIKFGDVVSGDCGMTMMVMLGGGSKARLETPFMIFQNNRCSHLLQGVPDNVPGVCYHSGAKGWMDLRVFSEWLSEKRVMRPLLGGRKRVLYVDNASGHMITEAAKQALKASNTILRFLPKNATDLCQPADSFIIQKIKTVWRRKWDEKKLQMIQRNEWVDWKSGSGKLPNPGKKYYLKLAADDIREVENDRDKDGVSYTRKAMMGCGMALNLNGRWEVSQLFPHLQEIVRKYEDNFNGTPVADGLELDGAVTESEDDCAED